MPTAYCQVMDSEWTDADLDAFWETYLRFRTLPPRIKAYRTIWGPRLVIIEPSARVIWTREAAMRAGRYWHKVVAVGSPV
jgi:hypothetical protein